jgi:hypothetical protein
MSQNTGSLGFDHGTGSASTYRPALLLLASYVSAFGEAASHTVFWCQLTQEAMKELGFWAGSMQKKKREKDKLFHANIFETWVITCQFDFVCCLPVMEDYKLIICKYIVWLFYFA